MGVAKGVTPFLILYFLWVIFFAAMSVILGFNKELAEGYKGIPTWSGYILQTFEDSIGNISNPTINDFKEPANFLDGLIIFLIYFFWMFAQIFLLVILLNYMIALISQYYEDVMNSKIEHVYTMK